MPRWYICNNPCLTARLPLLGCASCSVTAHAVHAYIFSNERTELRNETRFDWYVSRVAKHWHRYRISKVATEKPQFKMMASKPRGTACAVHLGLSLALIVGEDPEIGVAVLLPRSILCGQRQRCLIGGDMGALAAGGEVRLER